MPARKSLDNDAAVDIAADANHAVLAEGVMNGASARSITPAELQRLRGLQAEILESNNLLNVLQQLRDLRVERYEMFLEILALRYQLDPATQEIRLADGRVVSRADVADRGPS